MSLLLAAAAAAATTHSCTTVSTVKQIKEQSRFFSPPLTNSRRKKKRKEKQLEAPSLSHVAHSHTFFFLAGPRRRSPEASLLEELVRKRSAFPRDERGRERGGTEQEFGGAPERRELRGVRVLTGGGGWIQENLKERREKAKGNGGGGRDLEL